jgi:hypothetical protein
MDRQQLIELMFKISSDRDAFEKLESSLGGLGKTEIEQLLIECGVLPEIFEHDSSEEKLWSKYSDILLAQSFNFLGIRAEVIRTRGDSADVLGKTSIYSIVGDAKTFRLSRTAKNQKDFKVKALDDWRRTNDYAVLIGPWNQFPSNGSQIYQQAVEHNVTLLSYTHLRFMLEFFTRIEDLSRIWQTGRRLNSSLSKSQKKKAENYWREIDRVVCEVFKNDGSNLRTLKEIERETTNRLGLEGIQYWESKIAEYQSLSKEEAIARLIKSAKIEQKIEQIRRAMNREYLI